MSQENVERFRKAVEAFNDADGEAWLAAFDPEIVFEPQIAEVDGAYAGQDGLRDFLATIADIYEGFRVDIDEVRDLGDRVLAMGTAVNTGKGSGIEYRQPLTILVTFRHGLMTHFKDYGGNKAKALEAAGLSE